MSVRLGAVSYLNARPLAAGLEGEPHSFDVVRAVPSQCAADLHAGRIDVGLIPSIEYARGPEPYCMVPEVAIAARGPVLTVRLFWRGDLRAVRRVALDTSSRTSAALLRVLMREKFGMEPEFAAARPDLEEMLLRADAALLIGDAVFGAGDAGCESLDLGAEWVGFTGHPFVFAFWAGRQGALSPSQVDQLVRARDQGRMRVREIALDFSEAQKRAGLPAAFYERYLTDHICFELGEAELAGLRTFYELAYGHGLIPVIPELRFYDRADARKWAVRGKMAAG
jgi:chorismate dehydratase